MALVSVKLSSSEISSKTICCLFLVNAVLASIDLFSFLDRVTSRDYLLTKFVHYNLPG